ncbi:glycosyltransferase [Lysobacter sp. GX 14042]|uniref:glycosyltransferase family 2 protein n=1 Tax=Lysobacter sp. GX 14042 TaxID=2907155 RepID=UPI001F3146EB|nr:glycosyltransferase [Lysobacter sp. GX 14042]MCE7032780.1 glycosyltransferase [Lysobacter sp. GX 14042]
MEAREDELAILLGSNSLKLTAPLRWLRRRFGRAEMPAEVNLASKQKLPPAVRAFPRRLIEFDPPPDPNQSHRPLRLDGAIQPLVPVKVRAGLLEDSTDPKGVRYHGREAEPFRLATIANRELREELSFDAAVLPLQAGAWREQLQVGRVSLVLIEGAWDPEGGWGAGFGGSPASQRCLQPLLDHCRQVGLPVVLWAREDASALDRLVWLMARVDRVYAVDPEGMQWMQRNITGVPVALLPVAVQPALYNPVRSYGIKEAQPGLEGAVLFDGWWALVSGAGDNPVVPAIGDRLRVVDTDGDYSWARLLDGAGHAGLSLGSVTPLEKSALLRSGAAELFLPHPHFRSWRQANSMMRAAVSGAAVLWAEQGAPPWEGGKSVRVSTLEEKLGGANMAAWIDARARHLVVREILSRHCLADRLTVILRDLGLDGTRPSPQQVAHLLVTMRPRLLERCLDRFRADRYPYRELVVVLHGDDLDVTVAKALVRPDEPVTILQASTNRSLGDCLNMAIGHTQAPIWMKLDDDDYYGPAYTQDMMLYRRAIDAPLMGKPPAFVHLQQGDELRWNPMWAAQANLLHDAEEATSALVAGGTLGGKREVLETIGFSAARRGGSDSEFIQRCFEHGHGLLATDYFNFVRYRDAAAGTHTWKIPDEELRRGTAHVGSRDALVDHVFV